MMGCFLSALLAAACAAQETPPAASPGPFIEMRQPMLGAGCPQGTRRIETGGPLKFRCVTIKPKSKSAPDPARGLGIYKPHRVGALRLDIPRGWHVTEAWSDEVPTLYVEYETGKPGKQVTLVVSRFEPSQPGYEDMQKAIAKEKEYQGAQEGAGRRVGGLPGRHTMVIKESRAAYVDAGGGIYYVLAYSAPQRLFEAFEPTYERLMTSFLAGER